MDNNFDATKGREAKMSVIPFIEWARDAINKGNSKYGNTSDDDDDKNTDNNNKKNQKSIFIATTFLKNASPAFLKVNDDVDRLVKIGRSLVDLIDLMGDNEGDEEGLKLALQDIVQSCDILATEDLKVPRVRFGKTEIQMPIATLGCMRFQQTWTSNKINKKDQINPIVQQNIYDIFHYAITKLGMNHIETAFAYGSSEIQIGLVLQRLLKENAVKREDLIIQTKVNPMTSSSQFRKTLETSFKHLNVEYIDLFSFHGLNMDSMYDLIFDNPNKDNGEENLIDIIKEYQRQGKIRHIGFSTHGQPSLIKKCIESDVFDYCNVHYHYFGSYTASGGSHTLGNHEYSGNLENIKLMKEKDMGVFIISPYDKGGRLYAPSKKLRTLTLPDLEPIRFGSLWFWSHENLKVGVNSGDESNHAGYPIHTFTVGAARPSDLDEPAIAAYLYRTQKEQMLQKVQNVMNRLNDALMNDVWNSGDVEWYNTWYHGVPSCDTENDAYNFGQMLSLYNMMKAWGLYDYAKDRYGTFDGNLKQWDFKRSTKDNIDKRGRTGWGYMPGIALENEKDYMSYFENVPESNRQKVYDAIQFVHEYCSKSSSSKKKDEIPKEWETAFDMRPWVAFPER